MATTLIIVTVIVAVQILLRIEALHKQTIGVSEKVDELSHKMDEIKSFVAEIEDRTVGPLERSSRLFERGQPLTLSVLKRLTRGDEIRVVSKSYHYPFRDP